jgi:plasmid stabilization system protein ParE
MEYTVYLDDGVREDMLEIAEWIARDSPGEAARWMLRIWDAIESLRTFPERCPIWRQVESRGQEIRHLIVGDYRVLFTIDDDRVLVLHVRHAARREDGRG